jgi:hypothetical protein
MKSDEHARSRRKPRWIEGLANQVVGGICAAVFLGYGVWAGVTAPGAYEAERLARAAGPPIEAVARGSKCNLVTARATSRCSTWFGYTDRDGTEGSFWAPGEFAPGTTRLVHPHLEDRRKVYRADRSCCEAHWNVASAVVGVGVGLALVAGMVLPRRRA